MEIFFKVNKIEVSPSKLSSIEYNTNNNKITFNMFLNGNAAHLIYDHPAGQITYVNETTGNFDYLDFIFRDYFEYKLIRESSGKIILSQRYI